MIWASLCDVASCHSYPNFRALGWQPRGRSHRGLFNTDLDPIYPISVAHAISSTGGSSEIADFLRAVTFSVAGHLTFAISP